MTVRIFLYFWMLIKTLALLHACVHKFTQLSPYTSIACILCQNISHIFLIKTYKNQNFQKISSQCHCKHTKTGFIQWSPYAYNCLYMYVCVYLKPFKLRTHLKPFKLRTHDCGSYHQMSGHNPR